MEIKHRYVYEDVDRHGNVRFYFKRSKGHPKVRITAQPGTAEFAEVYHALLRGAAQPQQQPDRPARGTLRWLVALYVVSPSFKSLDFRNQRVQRQLLEHCCREPVHAGAAETFAGFPLDRLTTKALRVLRDRKAATPASANNRVKALRRMFQWAMDEDHITSNPCRDLKRIKRQSEGWHTWTLEEVEQFEARHPLETTARLALALLLYTGARRSDVIRLGPQHVNGNSISWRPWKGRNTAKQVITIPIMPELAEAIAASKANGLAFLINGYGAPYTHAGFGNWFRARCDEAGLQHCTAHGLRKAGATMAAESGATTQQLMAIYGWRSLADAELYTRSANRVRLAEAGIQYLSRSQKFPTAETSGKELTKKRK